MHDGVFSNQIPHRAEMGTAAFFHGDRFDWWNTLLPAYGYQEVTNSAA